jgi:hypothetical protein
VTTTARRRCRNRAVLDGSRFLVAERADGDRVVLDVASGTYLRLEGAAGEILELLCATPTPEEAAAILAERHRLDRAGAERDVATVLEGIGALPRAAARSPRRPSLRGVLRETRRWWQLAPADRVAAAQVAAVLAAVEVGLRHRDLLDLAARLGVPVRSDGGSTGRPSGGAGSTLEDRELRQLAAVPWVLRRWPLPETCLRRALVTGWVLRRHRPALLLGLTADGVTAHAWVEADGVAYGAGETVGDFEPLSAPRPTPSPGAGSR